MKLLLLLLICDVDETAVVGNVANGSVCPSVLSGEENKDSPSKCYIEVDEKVVDPLRDKDSKFTAAKANEHVSSPKIRVEVPAPTHDDDEAHLRADVDSEDEEVKHEDFKEGAQDSPMTPGWGSKNSEGHKTSSKDNSH